MLTDSDSHDRIGGRGNPQTEPQSSPSFRTANHGNLPLSGERSSPNLPDIIQRYVNGESIQTLAAEHRVNRQTIYNWMLAETGPEYDSIITQALVKRIADADEKLENSPDMLGITRAREMARFSRQDFERRRPKLYGPKQELSVDTTVTVVLNKPVTPHIDQNATIIDATPERIDNTSNNE